MLKISLKFNPKDFASFSAFEKVMKRQLGEVHVGTDSCVVLVSYPKELAAMLRPYPVKEQFEFEF